ncbi:MAG: hypothetical protein KIT09_16840, partial [Bryobacteraceae bacterium]|nr:hypothetical protein [Bryobacteraceae bacterium]
MRIFFNVSAVCAPARQVELVDVQNVEDNSPRSPAGTGNVEGVELGTDDRDFRVRASSPGAKLRAYSAVYRVTNHFGIEHTVPALIVAPSRIEQVVRIWLARFRARGPATRPPQANPSSPRMPVERRQFGAAAVDVCRRRAPPDVLVGPCPPPTWQSAAAAVQVNRTVKVASGASQIKPGPLSQVRQHLLPAR